jgi:rRNA pseudouridine-1189 N-methylase Emg1 (Nep1/Mra1 family)
MKEFFDIDYDRVSALMAQLLELRQGCLDGELDEVCEKHIREVVKQEFNLKEIEE